MNAAIRILPAKLTWPYSIPQNAFILSASIKDNIIFGTKFDKAFYEKVLDACALRPDLAIMAEGDATQVGEKGQANAAAAKKRELHADKNFACNRCFLERRSEGSNQLGKMRLRPSGLVLAR